jgi:hypothetical protein
MAGWNQTWKMGSPDEYPNPNMYDACKRAVREHMSGRRYMLPITPPDLLFKHFFDLPDLFLNFADVVFDFAFSL